MHQSIVLILSTAEYRWVKTQQGNKFENLAKREGIVVKETKEVTIRAINEGGPFDVNCPTSM